MPEFVSDYLTKQLITCIGNKRALLEPLLAGVNRVKSKLGKDKLRLGDFFSGSGVVSRMMKEHASFLISNDVEIYAEVIGMCYLSNFRDVNGAALKKAVKEVHGIALHDKSGGFISEMYAPMDDDDIQPGERVFYTRRNALYLDAACKAIALQPQSLQPFLLAPLLAEASIHANTSGVFKGFHKDGNGCGCFGGRKGDAVERIKGHVKLEEPLFSPFCAPVEVCRGDAGEIARRSPELDLVYLDPPYNQHPYGSNYFMLNLIATYKRPEAISKISGIPEDWGRSPYNYNHSAKETLFSLIDSCPSRFVMISYNSEGFIKYEEFLEFLHAHGKVEIIETEYHAFRGSRNFHGRSAKVTEYLYLLEKS